MTLRKCICGATPKMYSGTYGDDLRTVYCENCDLETLQWWDGNKAASNWNKMILRLKNEEKNKKMMK